MKVILWLDDDLVKKARKITAARETTLTAMIRRYLEEVVAQDWSRARREREALEQSFQKFQFKMGNATGHETTCMPASDFRDTHIPPHAYHARDRGKQRRIVVENPFRDTR